jgi:hypothetical protein
LHLWTLTEDFDSKAAVEVVLGIFLGWLSVHRRTLQKIAKDANSTAAIEVGRAREREVKVRADAAKAVVSAEKQRRKEVGSAQADAARDVKRAEKLQKRALDGKAAAEARL